MNVAEFRVFRLNILLLYLVVVQKVAIQASRFSTVMLTGLPQKNYTHQDVAKLVWHFFPKPNLHTWFYNVTVLPLQRRVETPHPGYFVVRQSILSSLFSLFFPLQAFVFFSSWSACRGFVKHHIRKPVSVKGCKLSVHLVLEDMQPGFTEVWNSLSLGGKTATMRGGEIKPPNIKLNIKVQIEDT